MSRFSTILWDVDGTLLDFLYSQHHALTKCFQTIKKEITEEMIDRFTEINNTFWARLELGEITKAELLTGRFIQLFEEYDIHGVDVEAFRQEYQKELGSVFCYIDDSLNIIKTLQGKVKQYVITNGVAATQQDKLKISGLGELMDGVFISDQVGAHKPEKQFFDYCLEYIEEKDLSRILIVGDSLTGDIKGGVLAGIPTCWYRHTGAENTTEYQADYEISDLHQIFDILDR